MSGIVGIYLSLPLTVEQKVEFYNRHYTGDPTPGLLAIGQRVQGDDMKALAFVNADRLRWKIETHKDVCLSFSGKPHLGGGALDLTDGIVLHRDALAKLAAFRGAELQARADAEAAQARVAILEKDKARWDWVKRKMAFAIMDAIMEHVEEKGGCVPGGITSTSIDTYIDSFIASEVAE